MGVGWGVPEGEIKKSKGRNRKSRNMGGEASGHLLMAPTLKKREYYRKKEVSKAGRDEQ